MARASSVQFKDELLENFIWKGKRALEDIRPRWDDDLINALPGNNSVNTNRSNNRRETVSCAARAAIVALQRFGKHISTIEAVFSALSVQMSYLKNKLPYVSVLVSEFRVLGRR
jgi:hypothetical protein